CDKHDRKESRSPGEELSTNRHDSLTRNLGNLNPKRSVQMKSKASISGHPIHPMLIPFPIALWATSFVVDVLFFFLRHPTLLVISKFMIAAGCIGAAAA